MKTNQSIRPGCSHNVVGFALNSNRDAGSLRNALAFVLLMLGLSAVFASQLTLSKTPPISGGVEPRPNVIVTVDDSGSMDKDINGNSTSTSAAKKITLLKNALNASFGSTDVLPDGRVRLAWQSMHDNGEFISGNGAQSIKLGAINSMKTFTGPHRTNFSSFVNGLRPGDYTPSIDMMKNVYTYLNAPENVQSPWADDPTAGTAQTTPYLACRRTFHIFMTDGLWNSQEFPSCSAGGTNSGTAANPVCNNSKITCPTGYSFKSNFDPNKVCRKGKKNNYQYTAGFWSENTSIWTTADRVDKGDGVSQTLPDLEQYEAVSTNAQVRAYRDIYGDDPAYSSTLSDFVFRNWATDLQDGRPGITQVNSAGTTISGNTQDMENAINPVLRKKDDEVVTVSGGTTTLQPYWNPKNDPATWQHVTQYMIGFGTEATDWGGVAPVWGGNTFGGDYAKLVNGVVAWPNVRTDSTSTSVSARAAELWHGAINGRGKYIPASSGDALVQAFKDILVDVIKDTSQPLITVTTSSSTLKAGTLAYVAGYKAENWAGQLFARPLNAVDKTVDIATTWDAANLLDASTFSVADRLVVSHNGTEGISWKTYSLLPDAQKNQLNRNATAVDNKGQDRVDYIRGDRTKEQAQTNGIFRDRNSRLGDIVNSNIWFVGRPASAYSDSAYATFRGTGPGGKGARTPMVYVGSNDGMLHGVVASSTQTHAGGTELLAYIPQGVAEGDLRKLSDPGYTHQYLVDGSPFSSDAFISTPLRTNAGWSTVLVGTLGLGGKGFFVLDVTDPADFTVNNVSKLVILDKTDTLGGSKDKDIGVITSPPVIDDAVPTKTRQVVKMNNDRWAVVVGNGYNSSNEAPVLLIQFLDGQKELVKISPCATPIDTTNCTFKGSNGLSGPRLVDLNADGKMDVAYAGDLKGNMWKFNLGSSTTSNWSVGFNNAPFMVAKGRASANLRPSATVVQPITAPPYAAMHPLGGVMVIFGTGRNLTDSDPSPSTPTIESFYGVWDNSTYSSSGGGVSMTDSTAINTTSDTNVPSTLVQQTIVSTVTDSGVVYNASSMNNVVYSTGSGTKRGWYLDLILSTNERALASPSLFDGNRVLLPSIVPKSGASSANESCTASSSAETSYFYILDMFTGKRTSGDLFDIATATSTPPNIIAMVGDGGSLIQDQLSPNIYAVPPCPPGQKCDMTEFKVNALKGRRVSWRKKQ